MHLKALLNIVLLPFLSVSILLGQEKAAYQIFDRDGQITTYAAMLSASKDSEVVLFGEIHNNPIAHWLQYELSKDLFMSFGPDLVFGAEMFEADDQIVMDEYFNGWIMERHFKAKAKLWNNYATDYRPLVELARENELSFIATNIPRRYAAMVHSGGFEALEDLSDQGKTYIAPLPVPYDPELPGYKAMLEMEGVPAHGMENFPKAQAIKDATMAHFIIQNLPPEGVFIHFNGAYHSNNDEGIVWYLHQYANEPLSVMTVSTVEQEGTEQLDERHQGLADFIIVVPATMTKTY